MVVIDNTTGKCYENLTQCKAAQLVGVNRITIYRWMKKNVKSMKRNNYTVYLWAVEM